MTRTELAETVHLEVETRTREGIKAVIGQTLEEEKTAPVGAAPPERTD